MNTEYVYCTAILHIVGEESYQETLKRFELFASVTVKEEGCIAFTVAPMSPQKQEIALWEIWENEEAFYQHHKMPHTIELAKKKLTEVKIFKSSHILNLEQMGQ